jgi:heme exporter protein D
MIGIADYFAMGGYGAFVWPAYAIAVTVLGGLALHVWRRHRSSTQALDRLQRRLGPTG